MGEGLTSVKILIFVGVFILYNTLIKQSNKFKSWYQFLRPSAFRINGLVSFLGHRRGSVLRLMFIDPKFDLYKH